MKESGKIRRLPVPVEGGRVETGPIQFGDDWPGIFIRGGNAAVWWLNLRVSKAEIYAGVANGTTARRLEQLMELMEQCDPTSKHS